MAKKESRTARWQAAASKAVQSLQELKEVQDEYEEWLGNLPDSLENSPVGEKLRIVVELDISSALETAEEAENIDLPVGFGRD